MNHPRLLLALALLSISACADVRPEASPDAGQPGSDAQPGDTSHNDADPAQDAAPDLPPDDDALPNDALDDASPEDDAGLPEDLPCAAPSDCPPELRCDTRLALCLEPQCQSDDDCADGLTCHIGACLAPVRIVTWNIESVGEPQSAQYDAAVSVLRRLGADVVAIQEINSAADTEHFEQLAAELGYPYTFIAPESPFGSQRNAVLSVIPFEVSRAITAADLSDDPNAADITRPFVQLRVQPHPARRPLTLYVHHAKSGGSNDAEFRQSCEAWRLAQSTAGLFSPNDHYALMGDFNEEITTGIRTPERFNAPPDNLPGGFVLGQDLQELLQSPDGLRNDPFGYLFDSNGPDTQALDAAQTNGDTGTRPQSGRRIDYILVSRATARLLPSTEVYNSTLDAPQTGLDKRPPVLPADTSAQASDHLPIIADIYLD